MSAEISMDKNQIDSYLNAVAKQYRKLNGKGMRAEITLIGGASILINYRFRDSTCDIDALIHAASSMKDAINYVTDTQGLPNGWLNDDFRHTTSYTPKLINFSKPYRTFSNIVDVRTITGEYLVAMKLKAFRQYKHDISDVVGILREHVRAGDSLTMERIDKAVQDLYDGWENMPENAHTLIRSVMEEADMDALYQVYAQEEAAAKEALITLDGEYPNVMKEDNLGDILRHLLEKTEVEQRESGQEMTMGF